jgi:hypothetical protein
MAGIAADRTKNFVATKSGALPDIWTGSINFVMTKSQQFVMTNF